MTLNLQSSNFLSSYYEQVSERLLLYLRNCQTLQRVRRDCSNLFNLYYENAFSINRSLDSRQPTGTPNVTASSIKLITSAQFQYKMANKSLPLGPASQNLPSMKWQICSTASLTFQLLIIYLYCFSCNINKVLSSEQRLRSRMLAKAFSMSPVISQHLAFQVIEAQSVSSIEIAVVNSRIACSQFLSNIKMIPRVQKYLATLSSDFSIALSISSRDYACIPKYKQRVALQKYRCAFYPVFKPCYMNQSIFTKPYVLIGYFKNSSFIITAVQKKGYGLSMQFDAFSKHQRAKFLSPLWYARIPSQIQMLQDAATESVFGSLQMIF